MSARRARHVGVLVAASLLAAGVFGACKVTVESGNDLQGLDDASSADDTSIAFDDADVGGLNLGDGPLDKKVVKLTVEPEGKTMEVINGDLAAAGASIGFSATATMSDGSSVPFSACVWTVDRIDLAAFTGSTLRATGNAGGSGKAICTGAGLTASANFSVMLRDSIDTSGLDAASKTALVSTVISDPKVTKLLYPYDATVFPRGLPSPELMWDGQTASDAYALKLEEPGMEFTSYFKTTNPARAVIPKEAWTKLLDTATPTVPLKVTLYRMAGGEGGTAFKSTSQSWTIAAANLKGTIYYWRINGGKVVRLKPGASAPEDYLKLGGGHTCVACHSVSHDGSTVVASYENAGPLPWVTFDAKTGAENYYAAGSNSGFQAIAPDGSVVVGGQTSDAPLTLSMAKGGSLEPSGLAAFGKAVHPAFSVDGKTLAFGVRKNGNWVDFTSSDLALASFDPTTNKFGPMKVIRPSGGRVMTYPSFTPDDQWIAYMDGNSSSRPALADLHLIRPDGTDDILLNKAGNAGVADVDKSLNYEPTFSPVLSGGYFWVVFVSSRQYGNRINKTYDAFRDKCGSPSWDATPCRNKQLWIAAIDASPKPGVDPSHAAFWLPGQDVKDQNMRGYWALDPCKKLGEGCEAGFECCDGACKGSGEDGKGPKICTKPPPGKCKEVGDKCTTSTDCCEHAVGIECIGGVCGKKLPS